MAARTRTKKKEKKEAGKAGEWAVMKPDGSEIPREGTAAEGRTLARGQAHMWIDKVV
jgi:hypothetical protein